MLNSIDDTQPSTMPNTRRQGCRSRRKGTLYPPLHFLSAGVAAQVPSIDSISSHRPIGPLPPRSIRLHSLVCKGINLSLPPRHQVTIRPGSPVLRASAQVADQCRHSRTLLYDLGARSADKEHTDLDRRTWRDQTALPEATSIRHRPETGWAGVERE